MRGFVVVWLKLIIGGRIDELIHLTDSRLLEGQHEDWDRMVVTHFRSREGRESEHLKSHQRSKRPSGFELKGVDGVTAGVTGGGESKDMVRLVAIRIR